MAVKPFSNAPEPLRERASPWSDVIHVCIIQVEDTLSIKLWLGKQQELNSY